MNRLQALHDAGVSIWLDTLSRELLDSGDFAELIADCAVTGATSNPTIFAKAITGSDRYDDQLRAAVASGARDPQELFFELALDDVRRAADLLRPAYDDSDGRDGFVSFECTPDLADDTQATIEQALELWGRLERPNVMIKVPGHRGRDPRDRGAHRPRRQRQHHAAVLRRALRAGDRRLRQRPRATRGRRRAGRRDRLGGLVLRLARRRQGRRAAARRLRLRGRVAIANAHRAYARYLDRFSETCSPTTAGARYATPAPARSDRCGPAPAPRTPPTPTCSTSTELIAPEAVNTMPEATLRAFADHGEAWTPPQRVAGAANATLRRAQDAGIDLDAITAQLEREGVRSFCDSYHELLACIETKLGATQASSGRASV